MSALIGETEQNLGSLDILVNNAGIQFTAPIAEFPEERWDAVMAINLSAVFHATKAAIPAMQRGAGAASSTSPRRMAWSPARRRSAYVAAKHGVLGLTKVAASSWRTAASPSMRSAPAGC